MRRRTTDPSLGRRRCSAWRHAARAGRGWAGAVAVAPNSTAAGERTLLPRPNPPRPRPGRAQAPRSFINSQRSTDVRGENCINEQVVGRPARPSLPTHRPNYTPSAIHKIFNDRVLHTHARADRQTPAAAHTYTENYN